MVETALLTQFRHRGVLADIYVILFNRPEVLNEKA
jgi:hypothetical protein